MILENIFFVRFARNDIILIFDDNYEIRPRIYLIQRFFLVHQENKIYIFSILGYFFKHLYLCKYGMFVLYMIHSLSIKIPSKINIGCEKIIKIIERV